MVDLIDFQRATFEKITSTTLASCGMGYGIGWAFTFVQDDMILCNMFQPWLYRSQYGSVSVQKYHLVMRGCNFSGGPGNGLGLQAVHITRCADEVLLAFFRKMQVMDAWCIAQQLLQLLGMVRDHMDGAIKISVGACTEDGVCRLHRISRLSMTYEKKVACGSGHGLIVASFCHDWVNCIG